jgi:hypothetical protein
LLEEKPYFLVVLLLIELVISFSLPKQSFSEKSEEIVGSARSIILIEKLVAR